MQQTGGYVLIHTQRGDGLLLLILALFIENQVPRYESSSLYERDLYALLKFAWITYKIREGFYFHKYVLVFMW